MRQEIEIEYKNLLTENEYLKLKDVFFSEDQKPATQENYYFDTEDFTLKHNKCALRIRLKDHRAEMTLKTPFEGHHTETTIDLDEDTAVKMIAETSFKLPDEILTVLNEENISISPSVSLVGSLKTERLELVDTHTIIVLDKSYYSDQIDYELEIESDSKSIGKALFDQILKNHGIPVRSTPNKIARAFNAGS